MDYKYGFRLVKNLFATVTIADIGQQPIDVGDRVQVLLTLGLPCIAGSSILDPVITFGGRVEIMDRPLCKRWGDLAGVVGSPYRTKTLVFTAVSWAGARRQATLLAFKELIKLRNACHDRLGALVVANSNLK